MSDADQQAGPINPARFEALVRGLSEMRDELAEVEDELAAANKRIQKLEEMLEFVGVDSIEPNTPDKRALAIRQWLWKEANNSKHGKASMDKDKAAGLLGNIARAQRYEAMRRAAGGNQQAEQGSSSLSDEPGFHFEKFGHDDDRSTRVRLNVEEAQRKYDSNLIGTEGDAE